MKKDVIQIIKDIKIEENKWSYKLFVPSKDLFKKNECRDFIRQYMKSAGTVSNLHEFTCVLDKDDFEGIDALRYQHIVFTYFLGLAIYDKCTSIQKAINDKFCDSEEYKSALRYHQEARFPYLWFLICLFHDLGYQYEKKTINSDKEYEEYEKLHSRLMLSEPPHQLSELKGVPEHYTIDDLIKSYYIYRAKIGKKYDHGICGGLHLFYTLCSIRRDKKKSVQQEPDDILWNDELEKIFALASSIVLCHNIYLPKEQDYEKYSNYNLNKLVELSKQVRSDMYKYPYKMEDYPVFFLFCLVDSIEPIKVVKDVNLLHNIFWDIQEDSITVSTNLTCGCKDRILQNASNLKDWLCKTKTEDCSVTIKF
ncbi:MAG: hypothetical protein MJZ29_02970 [Bacteroidaceae bacterium]|nr:hypothetical protein [Bacteroidaceae bacterium]